jgi:hypothetical protein
MNADITAEVVQQVVAALEELRLNANRLCDRQLGGTYEDDCRRSLQRADEALRAWRALRHQRECLAARVDLLRRLHSLPMPFVRWLR